MKTCTRCLIPQPLECYHKQSKAKDGLMYYCISCTSEIGAIWRLANPKPKKPKRIRRSMELEKAAKKKSYRAWYEKNGYSYFKKRMDSNPSAKISTLVRTRVSNAVKRFYDKGSKSAPTTELIGCSMQELKIHLELKFRDGMTWGNYGPFWHIDHIKPIAAFNLLNAEEQRACFHYTNLQPLLAEENLKKNKHYAH